MKINDLITQLQQVQAFHGGDLDIQIAVDMNDYDQVLASIVAIDTEHYEIPVLVISH